MGAMIAGYAGGFVDAMQPWAARGQYLNFAEHAVDTVGVLRADRLHAPARRQGARRPGQRDPGRTTPCRLDPVMGRVYEGIDERLATWIARQPLFFVGTAPAGRRRPRQRVAEGPDRDAEGARPAHRRVPRQGRQRRGDDRAPARERPDRDHAVRVRGTAADRAPARRRRHRAPAIHEDFEPPARGRLRRAAGARGPARDHPRPPDAGSPTRAATASR